VHQWITQSANDNNIFAGSVAFDVNESVNLSTVVTHDETQANEVAYETIVAMGGVSAYIDGDEADWSKNAGAGYKVNLERSWLLCGSKLQLRL
jgi:hypothetical protein